MNILLPPLLSRRHLLTSALLMLMVLINSSYAETVVDDNLYKISPGDVLSINVWKEESLTLPQVLVRPDGKFSMPLLGDIQAGGNTVIELQNNLKMQLEAYLRDEPILTVSLLQLNGNSVYVLGKVNRPGVYVMGAKLDVIQALALAGGLATFADEDDIVVLRREDTQQHISRVRYDRIKNGKSLETNILLKSGDVVMVP